MEKIKVKSFEDFFLDKKYFDKPHLVFVPIENTMSHSRLINEDKYTTGYNDVISALERLDNSRVSIATSYLSRYKIGLMNKTKYSLNIVDSHIVNLSLGESSIAMGASFKAGRPNLSNLLKSTQYRKKMFVANFIDGAKRCGQKDFTFYILNPYMFDPVQYSNSEFFPQADLFYRSFLRELVIRNFHNEDYINNIALHNKENVKIVGT